MERKTSLSRMLEPLEVHISTLRRNYLVPGTLSSQVSATFASRIVVALLSLIATAMIARLLGPSGRGEYAVALALGTIGVQLGNLGMHSSNAYVASTQRTFIPQLLGNSLLVSLGLGTLIALFLLFAFLQFPTIRPVSGGMLYLGLAWIPIGLLFVLLQAILMGGGAVDKYNYAEIAARAIGLLLLIAGWKVINGDPRLVFTTTMGGFLISALWMVKAVRSMTHGEVLFSWDLLYDNFSYGFKAYIAALLAFIVLRIDLLMVQEVLGSQSSGYYSVAVTVADMVLMLPTVVGTVLFPKLAALPDNALRWKKTTAAVLPTALVMSVLIAVVAIVAEPLTVVLFGREFVPAVPALLLLLPGIWLMSINILFMNLFASMRMPVIIVYSPGLAAITNIALNLKLIPAMGIAGASISSTICYGLMLMMSLAYIFSRRHELGGDRLHS